MVEKILVDLCVEAVGSLVSNGEFCRKALDHAPNHSPHCSADRHTRISVRVNGSIGLWLIGRWRDGWRWRWRWWRWDGWWRLGGGGMGGGGMGGGMGGGGMGGGGMGGGGMGGGGMGGGATGGIGRYLAVRTDRRCNRAMNGQQGQQQFLGRNTNAAQFLGRNTQGAGQNGMPNQNNGNRRGAANRNGNQNNINNQQQGGPAGARGQAAQLPQIRPRQKVAFEYSRPQLAMVSTKLEVRLNKMSAFQNKNVALSVDPSGGIVLKGDVKSAQDAKLAENMARLEPGVYSVRNELTYPTADADE